MMSSFVSRLTGFFFSDSSLDYYADEADDVILEDITELLNEDEG